MWSYKVNLHCQVTFQFVATAICDHINLEELCVGYTEYNKNEVYSYGMVQLLAPLSAAHTSRMLIADY